MCPVRSVTYVSGRSTQAGRGVPHSDAEIVSHRIPDSATACYRLRAFVPNNRASRPDTASSCIPGRNVTIDGQREGRRGAPETFLHHLGMRALLKQ
jgi:hypothetical protein